MKWMEVADVIDGNTENYKNVIYMWRNKVNDKLYIGQARDFRRRTKDHKRGSFNENLKYDYNVPLHKAIRKYGVENFEVCILEKDLDKYEEMNQKEIYYIEKYDTLSNKGKGYNLSNGGNNGYSLAGKTQEEIAEIRRKQSEANKGKFKGEKHPMYGRTGELNPMYGRTGKLNPTSRAVICVTTGVVYDSILEAERQTGVNQGNISNCCRGRNKSAGKLNGKKLVWMYYDKYLESLE